MWKNLELLTVLLAVLRPSLALQQKDAGNSGSSSKYAPYACFTGECAAAAAASKGTRDTSAFETCLKASLPYEASRNVVLPGSLAFTYASLMVNTRFKRTPAAVVYAHQTSDVQAAVKCAYRHGVQVTVAGGRHSYNSWSVVDDFLVVDTSNMTQVKVLGKQGQVLNVQVGPGNTNAFLISQLHKQGYSAAGTIIGQCPSVGVSGFMLGGGQGDLSRMFGLACDQLVALEMVTYKGDVVTANAQQNSDLLWAACGGGGGLGVITQWTVKAHDLGTEPFSQIEVNYNAQSVVPGMLKIQDFIMSQKTDLRFSGGGASPGGFNLYFAGPLDTAMRQLREAGLLNKAWLNPSVTSKATQSPSHLNNSPPTQIRISSIADMPAVGVRASTYANYYEAIMQAECGWVAGSAANWYVTNALKYGFGPDTSCSDPAIINKFKAMASDRSSPINTGISDLWRINGLINSCRLLPPLNATVWEALLAVRNDPRCGNMQTSSLQDVSKQLKADPDTAYYCFALKRLMGPPNWNHLLGGAVAKIPPTATAYPWRNAISPLCIDTGLPDDAFEADRVTLKGTYELLVPGQRGTVSVSPVAVVNAQKKVQAAYIKALYRALGEETAKGAYYNYMTDQAQDYEAAYWGPNYKRLQEIKTKWDPEGVFSKPLTVQPTKA